MDINEKPPYKWDSRALKIKKVEVNKYDEDELRQANLKFFEQIAAPGKNPFCEIGDRPLTRNTEENLQKLVSICTKKLSIEPEHQKALFIRASAYMKKNDYNNALGDCNKLILIQPNSIPSLYLRGIIYQKRGEIDKSVHDFTEVLNLDPNHVNAALARAACYNFLGNFDQAISDYDSALRKDKERRKGYFKRRKLEHNQFKGLDGSFASISSKGEYDSEPSETNSNPEINDDNNDKNILNRKGAVHPRNEDPTKYFNETKKTFNFTFTGSKQDISNGGGTQCTTTQQSQSNFKDSKLASPSKSTLSRSSQK